MIKANNEKLAEIWDAYLQSRVYGYDRAESYALHHKDTKPKGIEPRHFAIFAEGYLAGENKL